MRPAYTLAIRIAALLLQAAAFVGHDKARRAIRGRQGWRVRLAQAGLKARASGRTGPWIQVHCASLGEYEQAAPVLAEIRKAMPTRPLLLTFFSPSGRESVRTDVVDHIEYLPFDLPGATRDFAGFMAGGDAVFVKYELWPNLLVALRQREVRTHLIAARFDAHRHPLGRWGGWIRQHLTHMTSIQVQDAISLAALSAHGIRSTASGDPRADRVLESTHTAPEPNQTEALSRIEQWRGNRKLLVMGSAWEGEWKALVQASRDWPEDWACLVAPHEVRGGHLDRWSTASDVVRASAHDGAPYPPSAILILDQIGLLRHAYGLGDLAIVGGGWKAGVHNTLEAAAHALRIGVGPATSGFREIEGLQEAGALDILNTPSEMAQWIRHWMAPDQDGPRVESGTKARDWLSLHQGAAGRIVRGLGLPS